MYFYYTTDYFVSEFLAEAAYISLDPYQRMKLGSQFPCDMIGGQVAKLVFFFNI